MTSLGRRPVAIVPGDLDDPRVRDMLARHTTAARTATAPGSAHALDVEALKAPEIQFWAAWSGATLLGIGALKRLAADQGEVKSMFTENTQRRSGVGSAILRHIMNAARSMGMSRLNLETGSWDYFAPAREFYRKHGFRECPPFGEYVPDRNSVFMTLDLRGGDGGGHALRRAVTGEPALPRGPKPRRDDE